MAIWQTGITWAPPPELLSSDFNGALEHVANHFASWARRLARAVTRHKRNDMTQEARIRSGNSRGKHGLTEQQVRDRAARRTARTNYYFAVDLNNQLKAGKGKGNAKGKGKTTAVFQSSPKLWNDMREDERWWLFEFWAGRLRTAVDEAEEKCHRVQARPFVSDMEDV